MTLVGMDGRGQLNLARVQHAACRLVEIMVMWWLEVFQGIDRAGIPSSRAHISARPPHRTPATCFMPTPIYCAPQLLREEKTCSCWRGIRVKFHAPLSDIL
jgi:hypothetical protein